jgi:hypothetical protein
MAPRKGREGMNDKERLQEIKEYLFRSTRIANEKELEYEKWIISRVEKLLQENEKLKWHNQNLMNSGYGYTFELEKKLQQAQTKIDRYKNTIKETLELLKRGGPGTRSQVQRLLEEALEGEK